MENASPIIGSEFVVLDVRHSIDGVLNIWDPLAVLLRNPEIAE
jgi:hypothetical protein